MKLAKSIAAAGVAAMMVFTLGTFTGCNVNEENEEVIRNSITEEFEPYKNHDSSIINQIQSENAVALATIGIDGKEYAEALLNGFDYSIEDVTVDGKNASVTMIITQKDIDEDEAEAIMTGLAEDPEFVNMSMDERKALISEKIFEYINSVEAAPQDPVTIDFVMNGNTWELTDDSELRMKSLFTF